MTLVQSTSVGLDGHAEHRDAAAHDDVSRTADRRRPARRSSRAPTSKPSFIFEPRHDVAQVLAATTSTGVTSATSAASARRRGLMSVMTTWRAPTWRATAAAMMPIGPAPVISTSSPTRSKASAVWTALPSGSRMAPSSSSTSSGSGTMLKAGMRTIFGEGAGNVDADAARLAGRVKAPAARGAAVHADDMALAGDALADLRGRAHWRRARRSRRHIRGRSIIGTGSCFCAHSSQL